MRPYGVLLLPGLDGTGRMFEPFCASAPPIPAPEVLGYPGDRRLGYDELEAHVLRALPAGEPFAMVAESFSGPLALRVAAREPEGLFALVLVASFVRSPLRFVPPAARALVGSWMFGLPPSRWVLRRWFAGEDAPDELVEAMVQATRSVHPAVMAARVRELLAVDASEELRRCPCPILYLGGSRDRIVPSGVPAALRVLRPGLEHETIDAPHLVLQRNPAAAGRVIGDFLDRCRRAGAER